MAAYRLVRTTTGVLVLVVAVLLAGCIPATPPPNYLYPEPVVTTVTTAPTVVEAGATVTFTIAATHEVGVSRVDLAPFDPVAVRLPDTFGCGGEAAQVWSGPVTDRTIDVTCTFPSIAPSGLWTLRYSVEAVDSPTVKGSIPFTVTGGTDDTHAPVVLEANPGIGGNDYTPIAVDDPMVVHLRVTDPHGPITFSPPDNYPGYPGKDGYRSRTCTDVIQAISPEVYDLVRTCVHGPGRAIGAQSLVQVIAYDALGHAWVVHFKYDFPLG